MSEDPKTTLQKYTLQKTWIFLLDNQVSFAVWKRKKLSMKYEFS